MTSRPLFHIRTEPAPQEAVLSEMCQNLLTHARIAALQYRSAAHSDLFHACALLSIEKETARDAHLKALIKGLRGAMSRAPVFYRPGVVSRSFDENWLIAAFMACDAEDLDSLEFLLRSKVTAPNRRHIGFLLRGTLDHLNLI